MITKRTSFSWFYQLLEELFIYLFMEQEVFLSIKGLNLNKISIHIQTAYICLIIAVPVYKGFGMNLFEKIIFCLGQVLIRI